MPRLSLRDLVGSAQRIFIGTALRAKSRWTDDGRFIVTDTVVRIDQSLDGTAANGGTVIVSELGGSVDGIGLLDQQGKLLCLCCRINLALGGMDTHLALTQPQLRTLGLIGCKLLFIQFALGLFLGDQPLLLLLDAL